MPWYRESQPGIPNWEGTTELRGRLRSTSLLSHIMTVGGRGVEYQKRRNKNVTFTCGKINQKMAEARTSHWCVELYTVSVARTTRDSQKTERDRMFRPQYTRKQCFNNLET